MATIDGKDLAASVKLVEALGKEINSLNDTLKEMLRNALEAGDGGWVVKDAEQYSRNVESEWLISDTAVVVPLKKKGKGIHKAIRYLSCQISTIGDGMEVQGNDEPLLHVHLWEYGVDFDDDKYFGFPYMKNEAELAWELRNGVLIDWSPEDAGAWHDRQWTFTLRLVSVNCRDDLQTKIIQPTMALLSAKTNSEFYDALSPNIPGLVHYQVINSERGPQISVCSE